jgi:heat shock protein HslJ
MSKYGLLTVLLSLGMLVVGCAAPDDDLEPPLTIHDTAWQVTSYDDGDGNLVEVLAGTEITAHFARERADGGTVYGFAGCNEYHGVYNTSPEDNVWPGIDLVLTTNNNCTEPAGVMEQEQQYLTALIHSRKWQIDGLEMIFSKTEYDEESESDQDVILVTFEYTGEAEEFSGGEEEFIVPEDGLEFTYAFEDDEEGWIAGFADLPVDYNQELYELESEWRDLPDDLDGSGIYLQSHNRSDDLFMYLKRKVDGLEPGTTYEAIFKLDIASNVPEGLSGIGGSPGESVYIKAGATTTEPENVEDDQGWWRMNIDKGNQASEGADMINIGDMANPNLTPDTVGQYELMTVDSAGREFEVTADETGAIWFIVGTDSGFEGLTTLYYDAISITLAPK